MMHKRVARRPHSEVSRFESTAVHAAAAEHWVPKDSAANVSQIITVDRDFLTEPAGRIRGQLLKDGENGLRLVLDLQANRAG
jgi:mRNA-degrading endonuclease toxin of MazEF toxin-antitoxin module